MLTKKQHELLLFINDRLQKRGVPPSFDEMKEALDLKSKSGIHRLIMALEERGFIRRIPNRARALEVLRMPGSGHSRSGFVPSVIDGTMGRVGGAVLSSGGVDVQKSDFDSGFVFGAADPNIVAKYLDQDRATIHVPVMGHIAAGTPIAALQNYSHNVPIAQSFLRAGDHFALEVRGDSMIDVGIHDGDMVIIRRQDTAQNGDIVVALIDEEEATLKRLRMRDNMIALEAANPNYETRLYPKSRVRIQGVLVTLMRQY